MHQILELHGCAPDPLMAYLKALGIFRMVAEQKDKDARAWWQNDTFCLKSSMDRDELIDFFLNQYSPTPIVSPWNGGSGFHPKDNDKAMRTILALESPRFQSWNQVISTCKNILLQPEAAAKGKKEWILAQCRVQFPDEALAWLDAAYVLTSRGPKYPPLLATGGNDGRLEFSNNFMQNLVSALNLDEQRNGASIAKSQAVAALFNEGSPELIRKRTSGFYNPGSVGGPNATQGFEGDQLTNPWDYVLMFEGALLFAGASARRLSPQAESKAVFPFTADNSAAGYGTSADSEYGGSSRAEFWAPFWNRPANLPELRHLMSEGRAQLGRKQASNGANFARAVAGLGAELGIAQFQRYGFLVRNGLAYLAAPLGRFHVRDHQSDAQRADVLFDLDPWLDALRRAAAGQRSPAGLGTALRQVDQAIIEFCQRGQPRDLQNVLIAIGRTERWLAASSLRKSKNPVRPLNNLSRNWLRHANDQSAEFRLARAIASLLPGTGEGRQEVGPIRENLEPVSASPRAEWKDDSPSFVWKSGDVLSNMLSVLERRCIEGRVKGAAHPSLNATRTARLSDIAEFLNGNVDLQRIEALILPLSFIRHREPSEEASRRHSPPPAPLDPPVAYAAMKLTLLPGKFVWPSCGVDGTDIWMEPAMLAMLRAGRVNDAYRLAYRRLRASGLQPLTENPGIADRSPAARRLAAALLFPLDAGSQAALAEISLFKPGSIDEPA